MGLIGKVSNYAVSSLKYIAQKTDLGKEIAQIKQNALIAKSKPLDIPISNPIKELGDIFIHSQDRQLEIAAKLATNKEFSNGFQAYLNTSFRNLSNTTQKTGNIDLKTLTESSGVGINKVLQIISSDKEAMAKMPPQLKKVILDSRSNNSSTRTLEEVQSELTNLFDNKYIVKKQLGVGTIGEAYLVNDGSGKDCVLKMVKKSVNKELLDSEEQIAIGLAEQLSQTPEKVAQNIKLIKSLYSNWKKELDFTLEARYNKLLAQGAKNYNVASIINISKDAKSVIYEKAEGIQLDNFVQMIKDFKSNPAEYAKKYQAVIAENPWMKNPLNASKKTFQGLIDSFNEMLLISKNGKGVIHGDPHSGNIFINKSENGKFMPTFIDTGNCCIRSSKDIYDDLKMFASYFVGNSKEVARYFVNHADSLPKNITKDQLVEQIANQIDKRLFKSGKNITKLEQNQKIINKILEEAAVGIKMEYMASLKASFQSARTIEEIASLSGESSEKLFRNLMLYVGKGIGRISMETNPVTLVKPAIKTLINDKETALGTLFQILY